LHHKSYSPIQNKTPDDYPYNCSSSSTGILAGNIKPWAPDFHRFKPVHGFGVVYHNEDKCLHY